MKMILITTTDVDIITGNIVGCDVYRQRDPVPSVGDVVRLTEQCAHGTPLHWAVVDNGNVAFYCFTSARLPPTEDV